MHHAPGEHLGERTERDTHKQGARSERLTRNSMQWYRRPKRGACTKHGSHIGALRRHESHKGA